MTQPSAPITTTDLIAASVRTLEAGGYKSITGSVSEWNTTSTRLFEDAYNVVGLAVFNTCAELLRSWADLQGSLVDVISRQIGKGESKAWDGYLVLLTPGIAPSNDLEIEAIRYDTTRLRKLIATGDDIKLASDVERVLRPLLPLRTERTVHTESSALDRLPQLLEERGIDRHITGTIVKLFLEQKSIIEMLHQSRGNR